MGARQSTIHDMQLKIKLISQEKELLNAEAGEVILPTTLGQISVLPQHQSTVVVLVPGEVELRTGLNGKLIQSFFVGSGIAEIREGAEVMILAETAEEANEIIEERAQAAKERAEKLLREEGTKDEVKFAEATAALEKAMARLRLVHKHRSRH